MTSLEFQAQQHDWHEQRQLKNMTRNLYQDDTVYYTHADDMILFYPYTLPFEISIPNTSPISLDKVEAWIPALVGDVRSFYAKFDTDLPAGKAKFVAMLKSELGDSFTFDALEAFVNE